MILLYPTKSRINRIIIHRDYSQKTIFNMAASAILNLQNFGILLSSRPWKHNLHLQISLKSDDFRLRYSDITIFKMAADRHLEFSKFGILVIRPLLECDSTLSYKISR